MEDTRRKVEMWRYIIIGILFTIGGLSGVWVLRGTISSIALVCVGIGIIIFGIVRGIKPSQTVPQIPDDPLLKDAKVVQFYNNTINAWRQGRLNDLNPVFQRIGTYDYNTFVTEHFPEPDSALRVFLEKYNPRGDEFLVECGNDSSAKAWYVLTNIRIIQKDGKNGDFSEILLSNLQVNGIKTIDRDITFNLKNNESISLENVASYPNLYYVRKLIALPPTKPNFKYNY